MEILSITNIQLIENFLMKYEESSLFLLANLIEYGPTLGAHLNSGDYFGIYSDDILVSIFSLTKRGNFLLQAGEFEIDIQQLFDFLSKNSPVPITGCLGSDSVSLAIFQLLRKLGLKESYRSREVLYSKELKDSQGLESKARRLSNSDFESWRQLQISFAKEVGLESNLKKTYYLELFEKKCSGVGVAGYSINDELVSCAHLNATFRALCQVGGVFTIPKSRKSGFSKDCMNLLMKNSFEHGFKKMILFTGEGNHSAQKLYESIGFENIGHYGLYIGAYD